MKKLTYFFLLTFFFCGEAVAQIEPTRVNQLEERVSTLEQKIKQFANTSYALILFGAFCALWAQNTGRNARLWFFLGAVFSVFAVLALLWKNSNDIDQRRQTP